MEKCEKCGMPMEDDESCSCDSKKCYNCCKCPDGCSCKCTDREISEIEKEKEESK